MQESPRRQRSQRSSRPHRRLGVSALSGVLLLLLAGGFVYLMTSRQGGSDSEVTPTALIPAHGGTFTEGDIGAPSSFNPLLAQTQSEQDLAHLLFSSLTQVDGSGMARPELAERWDVSENGLVYTFSLRHDAVWQDGQPLTAQDVLFTVRAMQDPGFPGDPALAQFWRGVVVTVPSQWSVQFRLLDAFAAFPTYTTFPVLPRHLLQGVLPADLADGPFSRMPVGSGPFRLVTWDANRSVATLSAFDRYFGGTPYLDQVELHYYKDGDALAAAVKKGEVDGTGSLSASDVMQPGALPKDAVIYGPAMASFTALFFNLRAPIFADADVRRALELAIDRPGLASTQLHDRVVAGTGPIPASSWAYQPGPTPEFDPSAAEDLLTKGGWVDADGDDVREKGSTQLSFPLLVNDDDPDRLVAAQVISAQLAQIGVRATVQTAPSSDVSQQLASRQFTAAVFGWHAASGDPDCYQLWHSSGADDGLNFTGIRDEQIDTLLDEARKTTDIDARKAKYSAFQKAFAEQVPAIVLYYPRYYFVVSARVHGVEPLAVIEPSNRFDQLPRWFVVSADRGATPAK